jgi:hypothetical protein
MFPPYTGGDIACGGLLGQRILGLMFPRMHCLWSGGRCASGCAYFTPVVYLSDLSTVGYVLVDEQREVGAMWRDFSTPFDPIR